jgi:chaperonin GroES
MSQLQLQPLNDRVVLKRLEAPATTPGGLVLPDVAREKPTTGLVLAVGPGKVLDDGGRGAMDVAPGDVVLFRKYGGEDYKVGGDALVLIAQDDILALLSAPPSQDEGARNDRV